MGEQPSSIEDRPATQTRWLAVGRSTRAGARDAGREAAAEALRGGEDPRLVLVFCSEAYDLPALLAGIREHAAGVPLIGCSTAGEIAADGPRDHSVVVTVLGGAGFRVCTRAAIAREQRLREAGADVARAAREIAGCEHRVLMLLTDGLAGDQQEFVRGAYGVVGAEVPLVGGCAGDSLKMVRTFQLHDDRILTGAVVAAAIGSDAPLGIGVRHGCRRTGAPMVVTRASGSRIEQIDDEPALDVYLDRLGAPADARSDPGAFTRFALMHPLGLARRRGEGFVRFVNAPGYDDRSLGGYVPQGAVAWFMTGDEDSALAATDAACADALRALGDRPPLGLIAFDCISRRMVLREGIEPEIQRVAASAAGAPVAGFYTYGEIARTRGLSGFHNHTLVILAVS